MPLKILNIDSMGLIARFPAFIGASLMLAVSWVGCAPEARPNLPLPHLEPSARDAHLADGGAAGHEAGSHDDWSTMEDLLGQQRPGPGLPVSMPHRPSTPLPASFHAIVLATFPQDDGTQAQLWRRQLAAVLPATTGHVHHQVNDQGSMVLYGRYDRWDDPRAKEDLKALGAIRINNARVFGPLIITHIEPPRDPSTIGPWELAAARLAHPDTRGLYTLEVAIWGDFESGQWPAPKRRSRAEDQVRQLRQQGHEAYYHHDEARDLSTVTIGLFNDRAIDPRSGIASPRLERLRSAFPMRMVNGEPLNVPASSGAPSGTTRPQPSRLVEVPK